MKWSKNLFLNYNLKSWIFSLKFGLENANPFCPGAKELIMNIHVKVCQWYHYILEAPFTNLNPGMDK